MKYIRVYETKEDALEADPTKAKVICLDCVLDEREKVMKARIAAVKGLVSKARKKKKTKNRR